MPVPKINLPSDEQADQHIVSLHKRAFFARLAQHGLKPANELEAAAALDMGMDVVRESYDPAYRMSGAGLPKAAAADGPFVAAYRSLATAQGREVAPGVFAKASAALPQPPENKALWDSCVNGAVELLQSNPDLLGAAIMKRAMLDEAAAGDTDDEASEVQANAA